MGLSSPFMGTGGGGWGRLGKYPPEAGDGADLDIFPIYGEVPAGGGGWGRLGKYPPEAGMGPTCISSPFMGKYPPEAGDGADLLSP
jgi:hypothetical protein